jgi:hypothetical protein
LKRFIIATNYDPLGFTACLPRGAVRKVARSRFGISSFASCSPRA